MEYQETAIDKSQDASEAETDEVIENPPVRKTRVTLDQAMIVVASFAQYFLNSFCYTCSPFLYVEWIEYFQSSGGETGWIFSVSPIVVSVLSVLQGTLIEMYSCRMVALIGGVLTFIGCFFCYFAPSITVLIITFGLLAGIGRGMAILCCSIIVQQAFNLHKYRPLAIGISMSGDSIGTFVCGPIFQFLLDLYGWRGTLLITSGLMLNMVPFALIFGWLSPLESPKDDTKDLDSSTKRNQSSTKKIRSIVSTFLSILSDFTVFKNLRFVLYLVGCTLMYFGLTPFYTHLLTRAVSYGLSKHQVAIIPSLVGAASFFGRLLFGFLTSKKCVNGMVIFALITVILGILTAISGWATNFPLYMTACVIIGFINGGVLMYETTLILDLVGIEQTPKAQAIYTMIVSVAEMACTPMVGYIFDVTQDYLAAFIIVGIMEALGGFVLFVIPVLSAKRTYSATEEHQPD